MTEQTAEVDPRVLERERWRLLRQIQALLEGPMTALGFIWLGLLILDLTMGLTRPLQLLANGIWMLFILDFVVRLVIAPNKVAFLRHNWLTAISLLLPALRVLRVFQALRLLRAARAIRSVGLLRLLTSLNRSAAGVRRTLGRRGIGYVVTLTVLVTITGAAGMTYFESPTALREAGAIRPGEENVGLNGYDEALWWTAMIMTTLGSDYWPRTGEGRILTWLLAVYALAVFGYITATIASYFIGQDDPSARGRTPPDHLSAELAALRREIALLRARSADPSSRRATSALEPPIEDAPTGQPIEVGVSPRFRSD